MTRSYNYPALVRWLGHENIDSSRRAEPLPLAEELAATVQVADFKHLTVPLETLKFWLHTVSPAVTARYAVIGIDARNYAVAIEAVAGNGGAGNLWVGTTAGGGAANIVDLAPGHFGKEPPNDPMARYYEGDLLATAPAGTAADGFFIAENTGFAGVHYFNPPLVLRPGESFFITQAAVNTTLPFSIRGYEYAGER